MDHRESVLKRVAEDESIASMTNLELVRYLKAMRNAVITADAIQNEYQSHSNKKVWWICKRCGNEWQAVVYSRVAGRSCPECAKERRKK